MKNDTIGADAYTSSFICPFEGIYICMVGAYSVAGSTTCDNGTVIRSKQQVGCRMAVVYANVGATIQMSSSQNSGVYGLHSYYYLSGFKTALTDFEMSSGQNQGTTYAKSWSNNAANVICACSACTGVYSDVSVSFEGNVSASFNQTHYNSFVAVPDSSYCSYSITGTGYHNGGVSYITLE